MSEVKKQKVVLAHDGGEVQVPPGFRPLSRKERPRKGDIAWNGSSHFWEPIDLYSLRNYGAAGFKERAYGVLRPLARRKSE